MTSTLIECQRILLECDIQSVSVREGKSECLLFEGAAVIGFVLFYSDADSLLREWEDDINDLATKHQFGLRRAQAKAWNTYAVLLAAAPPSPTNQIALSAVEENLIGTRKIARAAIEKAEDVRAALLPLLPIQNAPRLEAVDMKAEIQLRTTELPALLVQAFLSDASDATVARVLEELP
jgi:hypothetical protein